MPTLYAHKLSQPARACLWFTEYAGLKDVDVRLVDMMKGEHKSPEYVAKFPAGQVPAFEDGDFCFAESTAILQYLAEGHPLLPKDKKGNALLQQYFGQHYANARKFSGEYMRFFIYAKSAEDFTAAEPKLLANITPLLEKFNTHFAKNAFILGSELSLADFLFAPEVDQLTFVDSTILAKYPHITKYLEKLSAEVAGYSKNVGDASDIVKFIRGRRGF